MSGHSKWSQIKHKKAQSDAKKGRLFSKISRMITLAARQGAKPDMNPELRLAIEKAKEINMPSDNIERAIKRALGKETEKLEEVLYEAYGPAGIGILIEGITDNKNRTLNELKHILNEHNAKLAESGSVLWLFEKKEGGWTPKYGVKLSDENDKTAFENLLEELSEQDDVQEVYSNAEL